MNVSVFVSFILKKFRLLDGRYFAVTVMRIIEFT